ncbi:hypothetical protein LCGC14_0509230 [marine sediment metagenome]|uniref:Uncharacterized protein n=1 Tax=marine sediment metagenome TaxID=412755 RepID=A0A0F9SK11_9ZZZZ|nr:hypothetical protein [bacterium]
MKATKGIIEHCEDVETFVVIPMGFCNEEMKVLIYDAPKHQNQYIIVGTKKEFRKKFEESK